MPNTIVALIIVALIAGILGYFVSVALAALWLVLVAVCWLVAGRA